MVRRLISQWGPCISLRRQHVPPTSAGSTKLLDNFIYRPEAHVSRNSRSLKFRSMLVNVLDIILNVKTGKSTWTCYNIFGYGIFAIPANKKWNNFFRPKSRILYWFFEIKRKDCLVWKIKWKYTRIRSGKNVRFPTLKYTLHNMLLTASKLTT